MKKKPELIDHNLSRKQWNMPSEFVSYIWITPKKTKDKKLKLYCEVSLIYMSVIQLRFNIYYLTNFRDNLFENTQYNETNLKNKKKLNHPF